MEPKVKFVNVSKTYNFHKKQSDKLLDLLSIRKKTKQFSALRDISFEVKEGESIGVIGINGSGKSTLSNLLAQVVEPTKGKVQIDGESSLIAISAGLNNNLTGYENIELKCLMLGLRKEEIHRITPSIIDFADIGDFMYQPVKNYSSGMKSRLGFSISIHTNPDVLIVDEALSVGDQTFYQKCINKMEEFKKQGKTIFFISHSISQIRSFCDRVLWLHFGEIKQFGDKKQVLKEYKEFIEWFNSLSEKEKKDYRSTMLQEQFDPQEFFRGKTRSSKKRNKKDPLFQIKRTLQILFICILLLTSTLFMFVDLDMYKEASKDNNQMDNKVESNEQTINKEINKNGIVIGNPARVYSDIELRKTGSTISFGTPVLVIEETGNLYRIKNDHVSGYVNLEEIKLLEKNIEINKLFLEDILVFTPNTFSAAYSFYIAHLGMPYMDVKSSLRGLTGESVNDTGKKIQYYDGENIGIIFDENDFAESIIVSNINIEDPFLNDLLTLASIKNGEEVYLILINGYEVIINLHDKKMILKPM
ncbi:teichoic acids export ABC transporter ATP-binding subunit TagH [Cytobacillus firmus]|nr:teichoic acids export ABC transporter ATP-binding subunit TagH [Cytobacillus firmus]